MEDNLKRRRKMKESWRIVALVVAVSLVISGGCGKKAEESKPSLRREGEAKPAPPEEREGKVLARVNGLPIYEGDVFPELDGGMPPGMSDEDKSRIMGERLEGAIEQMLFIQEAKRMGLEKDPEYRENLKQRKIMEKQEKAQILARYYESTVPELRKAWNPEAVSEQEVDKYYEENKERYQRLSEKRAHSSIRALLAQRRYTEAYKEWLKKKLSRSEVKVNGEAMSSKVLVSSLDSLFPTPGEAYRSLISPFGGEARDLIIKQAAERRKTTKEEIEKDQKLVREILSSALFSAEGEEFSVGPMAGSEGVPDFRIMEQALHLAKTYLVAAEARKKGIEKDPEYLAQQRRMTFSPHGKDALLISSLLKKKGIYDYRKIEVSEGEIDAYYEQNQRRYERVGRSRARPSIRRILQNQKANQMRKDLVARLRAKARVEIF